MNAPKRSSAFDSSTRRCYLCKRELPLDAFRTITSSSNQGKYKYVTPSHDCRECNNKYKREQRRRKAVAEGRPFQQRGDRLEWEASRRAVRERKRAEGIARGERHNEAQRAEAQLRRDRRQQRPALTCRQCRATLPRSAFHPSMIAAGRTMCKDCVSVTSATQFQKDRDSLSDRYIRRMLTKHSGLTAKQIPAALIEAKRVQLMIERQLHPHRRPGGPRAWLRSQLSRGPVDAARLNAAARAAGIAFEPLQRERRALAVYDPETSTWSPREQHEQAITE